jgi:hypothetical protein
VENFLFHFTGCRLKPSRFTFSDQQLKTLLAGQNSSNLHAHIEGPTRVSPVNDTQARETALASAFAKRQH